MEHTHSKTNVLWKQIVKNKCIYLLAIPVLAYYIIFHYLPMYGAVIAFKQYSPGLGIWGSRWVGLRNFNSIFRDIYFTRTLRNTMLISGLNILVGFPVPIILAILLNELKNKRFKSIVQTVTYMPHFVSVVVVCGMLIQFCSKDGLFNTIRAAMGMEKISMLLQENMFRPIYILSDIWQQAGWGSIVYLAALSNVDMELYEAARIDGANKLQQVIHVTIPAILPTIVVMLILRIGKVMNVGHEKILLLYNSATYETADVISTYAYRKGLMDYNYSYSTAVSLFNSVVNFALVLFTNTLSRKLNDTSLW